MDKGTETQPPDLYKKYFVDNGNERNELFKLIQKEFDVQKALYPGSFAHITPSFYMQEVVYMDMDKRCQKFFSEPQTEAYIQLKKAYKEDAIYRFYEGDFSNPIDEQDNYFDLLISQYSGFISKYCSRYLRQNGILLVNDSHGDATVAFTSGNFDLIGVIDDEVAINSEGLDEYFRFSRKKTIDIEDVLKKMKGPKYKKMASSYVFRKK